MKQLFLFFSLLTATVSFSQKDCSFLTSFDSLHNFLKENYAGYSDKVNASNQKEFDAFTAKQVQRMKGAKNEGQYYQVLRNWVDFFQDRHLTISVPFDTANGNLAKAIAATEQLKLTASVLDKLETTPNTAIEGIYYTIDSSYKIAVIKNDNGFRQYAGVVLSAKAPEWKPGSVKFELVPAGNNAFDVIWYNRYHFPLFSKLDFSRENTFHTEGWYKNNYVKGNATVNTYTPPFPEENSYNAFVKKIDDETSYIRIGSFDSDYIEQIDSVIKANKTQLETLPYLVIDIRGNGGGADISYRPLKRLVYTDPVKSIGVDLLATPYNIDITLKLIDGISGMPDAEKKEYHDILERARRSGTRMFNFSPDTTEVSEPLAFPKKIAVVVNSRVASTAEQFVLEATQSKKVTLFGTRTRGVLDYANVRSKLFCAGFEVYYPSTRSRRIEAGQGIDNIGIKPDVELDLKNPDWLKTVVSALKK